MLKKRTKQIIAVSGLVGIVGTAVPVGVVVGMQQSSAKQQAQQTEAAAPTTAPVPTSEQSPSAPTTNPADQPVPAPVKPDDQVSDTITAVDNTAAVYDEDGSLPTFLIVPPTPAPGYAIQGNYVWKTANGAVMDYASFRLLQDKQTFSAVWTLSPTGSSGGLPYTYTQRFVIEWPAVVIPDNQQSASVTRVDNTQRGSLPTDLLVQPAPEAGYQVFGSVKWTKADGTDLNNDGFVGLADKSRFFAVWTFNRTDGRPGTYTYSQIFEVVQVQAEVPANTQSPGVNQVDNLVRTTLPNDLLVTPAPHPDYQLSGPFVWTKADGSPLTLADYQQLADKASFNAVWTFVRKDGKTGSYTHTQRFEIAQSPVVVPADQSSATVTSVDNTLQNDLPAASLAPPTPQAGYKLAGTPVWTNEQGAPLTATAYKNLKNKSAFKAVWTLVRIDGRPYSYKYAQRFVIALTAYQNESSVAVIEYDNTSEEGLPNEQRVPPAPKPGYETFGEPVWQLPNGALLSLKDFALLPNGTEFGAVWTLFRTDGQPGSYTYTQRFIAKNDKIAAISEKNVYPTVYPVITDRTSVTFGFTKLPDVIAPTKLANYADWSTPAFTNEATGTAFDLTKLAEIPAGTIIKARMTAVPAEGYFGRTAEYVIRYVVQKARVEVDNSLLSTYGYGYMLNNEPTAALTGQLDKLRPARIEGYTDWSQKPEMQVKANFGPLKDLGSWRTIGDGSDGNTSLADFIASVKKWAASSPSVATGWSQTDPMTGGIVYDLEYRYVWKASLDQNHDGQPTVSFFQNFYLTNHLHVSALNDTPLYDLANTGYAKEGRLQLAINGGPVSVSFANMAEGIIYKYPLTVDTTTAASPTALAIKLPPEQKAANGTSVPTIFGDIYSYDKKANNGYFFYKWAAGNMLLKDAVYAPGMTDLATIVGRHVAFSSKPLVGFTYSSDNTEDLVKVANSLKLTELYYYAGYYYFPEDYENEQLDMNEIQKSLWDWNPSYNDPSGHVAKDYQINVRVGALKLPPVSGYDANGNPVYQQDGYSPVAPVSNVFFLGRERGKVNAEQLQSGYFNIIHTSSTVYTSIADRSAQTHFNIGSYTYIEGNTLRSFVFSYFENIPISNVRADVGFAYMVNDIAIDIEQ